MYVSKDGRNFDKSSLNPKLKKRKDPPRQMRPGAGGRAHMPGGAPAARLLGVGVCCGVKELQPTRGLPLAPLPGPSGQHDGWVEAAWGYTDLPTGNSPRYRTIACCTAHGTTVHLHVLGTHTPADISGRSRISAPQPPPPPFSQTGFTHLPASSTAVNLGHTGSITFLLMVQILSHSCAVAVHLGCRG